MYPPQTEGKPYASLHWSRSTGLPDQLELEPVEGLIDTSKPAEQIAMDFLNKWRDLLGIDPADLGKPKTVTEGSFGNLQYPQIYRGVPVLGGGVMIHIYPWKSVELRMVGTPTYYPNIHLTTTQPVYTAEQAVKIAARFDEIPPEYDPVKAQTNLVIYPDCGYPPRAAPCNFHLAWEVYLLDPPGFFGYFVDALTGQIIHDINTTVN